MICYSRGIYGATFSSNTVRIYLLNNCDFVRKRNDRLEYVLQVGRNVYSTYDFNSTKRSKNWALSQPEYSYFNIILATLLKKTVGRMFDVSGEKKCKN